MAGKWQGDDYRKYVDLEKPYDEYNHIERRAYVYQRLLEVGHQRNLDMPALGDKFGVSRRTMYNDLNAVAEFIEEHIGDQHFAEAEAVFDKAISKAMENGDYKDAVDMLEKRSAWLERRGVIEKEPEQHEMTWRDFINGSDDEESQS